MLVLRLIIIKKCVFKIDQAHSTTPQFCMVCPLHVMLGDMCEMGGK